MNKMNYTIDEKNKNFFNQQGDLIVENYLHIDKIDRYFFIQDTDVTYKIFDTLNDKIYLKIEKDYIIKNKEIITTIRDGLNNNLIFYIDSDKEPKFQINKVNEIYRIYDHDLISFYNPINNTYGWLSSKNLTIFMDGFKKTYNFKSNGIGSFCDSDNTYGFINKDKKIIGKGFLDCYDFYHEITNVKLPSGKWILLDIYGNCYINPTNKYVMIDDIIKLDDNNGYIYIYTNYKGSIETGITDESSKDIGYLYKGNNQIIIDNLLIVVPISKESDLYYIQFYTKDLKIGYIDRKLNIIYE